MSERANFRGGPGRGGGGNTGRGGVAGRGRGDRNDGAGAAARGGHHQQQQERPKKENILDLKKYLDKRITVKFSGGREVVGTLKGFDQLLNLTLDDVEETLQDEENNTASRQLGLLVARGTLLTSISPLDGSEEISNPFLGAQDED